jgi:DNA-binding MarR family transcriptional regulator/ribosomal protein S18 acetylase RimI-like enzyme
MEDTDHDRMLVALRRIMRAVDEHSRQLVRKQQVTVPQLLALKAIGEQSEIALGNVAKRIGLSNATVSGIVDRLEQRKLCIRRRGSADRRQMLLSLTSEGSLAVKRAPTLLQDRFTTAFDAMSPDERAGLLAAIGRVAAMMGAEDLDAAPVLTSHPMGVSERVLLAESGECPSKLPSGAALAVPSPMSAAAAEEGTVAASGKECLALRHFAAGAEGSTDLDIDRLVAFLHAEMQPYHDRPEDIRRGVVNALSGCPAPGGFILTANRGGGLVGALVMLATGMRGYVPEHLLLFVAVERSLRSRGIGRMLIARAMAMTSGDIKLHVEEENPARRLYESLGFVAKYAEMRLER